MKIIYNLDCIRAPMTGIGYYTQNMVLAMIHYYPDVEIIACRHNTLLSKQEILEVCSQFTEAPKKAPVWKVALIEIINQFAFARTIIQWQYNCRHYFKLRKLTKDYIYHEPNFVFLPHDGLKVLTTYDVSMFIYPEFLPKGRAKFLQQQMRRDIKEADALIVMCQFIKDQIVALLNIPENKIHIVPPGVKEDFMPRPASEVQASLEKFSLGYKQFLLCVATLEPRKNLIRLIKAYQTLPDNLQKEYPLVLVGNKGWLYEELLTLINESHSSTILLLRYVDEKILFHLYSAAKTFIYPSLYEGFGLPVLEAMQSGVPVITSNVSSLPEVCGDAGILIDPLNESAIAIAMEKFLTADDAAYADQVQRSLAQAKKFSWDSSVKKLYEAYHQISYKPT